MECVQCEKAVAGDTWEDGQCCIGGNTFACSVECARKWRDENCSTDTEIERCNKDGIFETVQ